MNSMGFQCKKCRKTLFTANEIVDCHDQPLDKVNTSTNSQCYYDDILFIGENKINEWISKQINSENWIKGRLVCPTDKCLARLGSFNFVNGETCRCGQHQLPSIRISRSRVDAPIKPILRIPDTIEMKFI
ncbi:hypothetical protein NH340_JMT04922 [Sarcoptes scabiei]|nr:hypothetical protein NH340_JMT04922 [Sarcoptes scabiei]